MIHETLKHAFISTTPLVSDRWRRGSATTAWLLALITFVGALLRLHAVTAKSFWLDEAISIAIVRLPWSQFLHMMWSREGNMALYYLLLRFWMAMGSSEMFVRGLSVFFSVATLPIIFLLGTRLFGRRAGLIAALLLAVNAYHIRYAQEARGYAMVVFFAVVATWLLARNLQEPSIAHWKIYGVVCALTAYCHFFGAMLVPAHALSLLCWRRGEIPWRKFTDGIAVFGAMIVPIAVVVFKTGAAPIAWVPPLQPNSLLDLGINFSGNYGHLLLVLDLAAIGITGIVARRAWQNGKTEAWGYVLLSSWLVVPIAIVMAGSLVKPMFFPRFLSFCLPALLLLVAAGISRSRPAAVSWGLCVAIVACSILGDMRYYRYDFDLEREDWRSATSYIFDHARPGDSILFYEPAGEAPFNYYSSQQTSVPFGLMTLQEPWMSADGNRATPQNSKSQYLVTVPGTSLRAIPPTGTRVWGILMYLNRSKQENETKKAISDWLSHGRHLADAKLFPLLGVVRFDKDAIGLLPTGGQTSVKYQEESDSLFVAKEKIR